MRLPRFATLALCCLGALTPVAATANHHEGDASRHADATRTLTMALASPSRAAADKARDAGRKPAQVLAYLGVQQGMTVIDLMAAGGYYTEVLSHAVGATGTVHAHNTAGMLRFRDGANERAIAARLADKRLPNVRRLDREMTNLGVEPGSVDAVITALNFHDIYNGAGPEAALGTARIVFAALKPGGVFGVIDHHGNAEHDNASLHRIEVQRVIDTLEAAGFVVEQSDLLRNTADLRDKGVFDPSVRGKTDRFVLRASKR